MEAPGFIVTTKDGAFNCYVEDHLLVQKSVCTRENASIVSHFITSYLALLSDSPLNNTFGRKPRTVYRNFLRYLTSRPIGESVKFFSRLFDKLASTLYLSNGDVIISSFLIEFRDTPIFKEYHEFTKTKDSRLLTYVFSFLAFGKKLDYHDESFNTVAFREWVKVEEEMTSLEFGTLNCIRSIIRAVLPDPDFGDLFPKFGPGAVSEVGVRGVILKANHLNYDPKIEMLLKGFFPHGQEVIRRIIPSGDNWRNTWRGIDHSTVRYVPKDVTKSRSIGMEPNVYMYIQQMIKDWMYEAFKKSDVLKRSITLEDQTLNQKYALWGSINGTLCTIDLSSASDRVHVDLVKKIFPRKWLIPLLGSRSSRVKTPDGTIVHVKKFAPMGSAVCFPVQCIIFYAIVIYAHLKRAGLVETPDSDISCDAVLSFINSNIAKDPSDFRKEFGPVAVYGDDIICDSKVVDDVVHSLEMLGFRVNESKSFKGMEALRESCGIYAVAGKVVTPLRYRVPFFDGALNPTAFSALPELINRAGRYGYFNLRRALLRLLEYQPLTRKDYHATQRRWYQRPPYPDSMALSEQLRKLFQTTSHTDRNNRIRFTAYADSLSARTTTVRTRSDQRSSVDGSTQPIVQRRCVASATSSAAQYTARSKENRKDKSSRFIPRIRAVDRPNNVLRVDYDRALDSSSASGREPMAILCRRRSNHKISPIGDDLNASLTRRYNSDLQREEVRFRVVEIKKKREPNALQRWDLDFCLYLKDMDARYHTEVTEPLKSSAVRYRPEETGYGWRWTPTM